MTNENIKKFLKIILALTIINIVLIKINNNIYNYLILIFALSCNIILIIIGIASLIINKIKKEV